MRVVQLSKLEVRNPTEDELLALIQADVIAWTGSTPGFYPKYAVEGPIHVGKILGDAPGSKVEDGMHYFVKTNVPVRDVLPTGPIVVIN